MPRKSRKITALLPTRSRDFVLLKKAVASVNWADEILIADSSKNQVGADKIKNFAQKIGAKYIYREYKYSADFKNWAIPQAKYDWILLLDSDEVVTEKLKLHIQRLLKSRQLKNYDGFGIARKHFFFGKFLKHGGRYPLYNVRLFRKKCRYEDRNVHAHIIIDKKRLLNINPRYGDILHYSDRDFDQFFERFNRYSDYQAQYILKMSQKKLSIDWWQFFTNFLYFKATVKDVWFFIPGHSLWRFVWMYILKFGFLDGRAGLNIAVLYAFQDFVSKTKYYHLVGKRARLRTNYQNILIYLIATLFNNRSQFIEEYQNLFFLNKGKVNTMKSV